MIQHFEFLDDIKIVKSTSQCNIWLSKLFILSAVRFEYVTIVWRSVAQIVCRSTFRKSFVALDIE